MAIRAINERRKQIKRVMQPPFNRSVDLSQFTVKKNTLSKFFAALVILTIKILTKNFTPLLN
jgi:hypothetical protein